MATTPKEMKRIEWGNFWNILESHEDIHLWPESFMFGLLYLIFDHPWLSSNNNFIHTCVNYFKKCQVDPGTPIGVISVQSFSERLTQSTLNSFHLSGTKDSPVVGVQSILDMLHVLTTPQTTTIYPFPRIVHKQDLEPITTKDMVEEFGVMFYPIVKTYPNKNKPPKLLNKIYCKYLKLKESYQNQFPKLFHLLKKLSIKFTLIHGNLLVCTNNVSLLKIKQVLKKLVSGLVWQSSSWEFEQGVLTLNKGGLQLNFIDFNYIAERVPILLCTDFFYKIRTNNLNFIYKNLGIEAVRTYLVETIPQILEKEGIHISFSHVELLVDNMTYQGRVSPYTRSGVNIDESVLLRASFETTSNTLANASVANMKDDLRCPTASIIFGKPSSIGSMYNLEIIEKNPKQEETIEEESEIEMSSPLPPTFSFEDLMSDDDDDEPHFHYYKSDEEGEEESPSKKFKNDSEMEMELELEI